MDLRTSALKRKNVRIFFYTVEHNLKLLHTLTGWKKIHAPLASNCFKKGEPCVQYWRRGDGFSRLSETLFKEAIFTNSSAKLLCLKSYNFVHDLIDQNQCQHCPFSWLLKSWASCISTSCKLASPHFIENEWSKANSRICTFGGLQTFRLSSQVDCQLFPPDWKANIKLIPLHKNRKCCFQVWKTRQETLVQREALFLSTQGWVNRMKWPIKRRLCGGQKMVSWPNVTWFVHPLRLQNVIRFDIIGMKDTLRTCETRLDMGFTWNHLRWS